MKIRIRFSKTEDLRFISHLDVMRYFQKALRRAHVDISYTQGFSPHPVMSFASPLGLGQTSEGEYVDIEVGSSQPSARMVERLNAVMAEGIQVLGFRRLPDTGKTNAMATIAAADYQVWLRPEEWIPRTSCRGYWESYLAQDAIVVHRKTKSREADSDIRPLIQAAQWREDGSFFLRLAAGSARNLKPEAVLDGFFLWLEEAGALPEGQKPALRIHRLDLYGEQDGKLVSLEDFGEDMV